MGIVEILFELVLLAVVFVCVVALIIACFFRRWKTAVAIVTVLAGGCWLLFPCDPFVRHTVTQAEIAGTYSLDRGWSHQQLERLGYQSFTGSVALSPDGTFAATQLPACCVHGMDDVVWRMKGSYFSFNGTWKVVQDEHVSAVRLVPSEARPSDTLSTGDPAELKRKAAMGGIDVDIMKGRPFSLGFSIFNGDYYYITFVHNK